MLWVDDHPENNDAERNLLTSRRITVDLARDGNAAVHRLEEKKYDLVLSDMRRDADERAGTKLLQEIMSRGFPVRVIFYATRFDPDLRIPRHAVGMTNRPDDS